MKVAKETKSFSAIFMMAALVVFLTACGGGGGGGGGAPTPTPVTKLSKFTVQELNAIPGDSSVILSWNNPNADIASINISYYNINIPNDPPTIVNSNQIDRNTPNVRQMISSGLTNGQSYNFTISLILKGADTGRERTAPFVTVTIGPNDDGDGTPNFLDVDDNGNGLIEIATPQELDQIRYNLLGNNFTRSDGGAGDARGCGGQNGITTCNGYELTQNISLSDYANWQPIGSCSTVTSSRICNNRNLFFNTTFDGNGWTISNLTITNPTGSVTGLFGGIYPTAVLRNVHIRSANVSGGSDSTGLLVGYAKGASISNSSASGEVTASGFYTGGLVGYGRDAIITSSYVMDVTVLSGGDQVGGLVGQGGNAIITSSYAAGGSVNGRNFVGGLVGNGRSATITSSYAVGGSAIGGSSVGGLVGQADNGAGVTLSYVDDFHVNATSGVSGLVGTGNELEITSSYVGADVVINSTGNSIGGLIGVADNNVMITSSYAAAEYVKGGNNVGGLVGNATATTINDSYWDNQTSGLTRTIGSTDGNSEGKTTAELQNSTIVAGSIYADWEDDLCGGDDDSPAWDLGTASQYPALTCTPNGLAPQRP